MMAKWGEWPTGSFTYARNEDGGLSFFAKGVPVGKIDNRDLIRLIQQAAELLK